MEQKNRTALLVAAVVIAVSLVAVNFERITGAVTDTQMDKPALGIDMSPSAVSGGQEITVTIRNKIKPGTNSYYKVKSPIEIQRVGGSEIDQCHLRAPCSGGLCDDPVIVTNCRTRPNWDGGYKVVANEYQGEDEIGIGYFTVT